MAQPESNERKWILLLCLLAAVHVFIFSAAFPLINNVDEQAHFDLVVKYSHGHVPRGLEPLSKESMRYIVIYGSQEFLWPPEVFQGGTFPPPPWTQPLEKIAPVLLAREAQWQNFNHESPQPPLYYVLAGLWWHIGKWCGFENGRLLYWLRFLNIVLVATLVWLGYSAARMIFPGNLFLRLGVPALVAFIPQTSFYSIQNGGLSALCFGAAFICLAHLLRTDTPTIRLSAATGLALAATYLTKAVNIPLLAVSLLMLSLKILRLAKTGKMRASLPALAVLALCAGIPAGLWMIWCEHYFGDLTGSTANIQFVGVTAKPIGEWLHHPIFTPHGLWTFVSDLLSRFWQGEFLWHNQPMTFPAVAAIYAILSIGLVALAVVNLCLKHISATGGQRQILWFSFACFIGLVAFWGFQSIIYNFDHCPNPTPKYPYFATGRYLLGALIPFLLLFVYGLDRALSFTKSRWPRWLALAAMILFMLVSEIAIDWPVFSSQYNWFHM
jgi:hypothetical protein